MSECSTMGCGSDANVYVSFGFAEAHSTLPSTLIRGLMWAMCTPCVLRSLANVNPYNAVPAPPVTRLERGWP